MIKNSLKYKNITFSILLLLIVLLNSCSKSSGDGSSNTGNTGGTPQVNTVTIQGFAFNPSTLTVPLNTTITWTNKDATAHTVTSDTGLFDSGSINTNGTFSFKFITSGTFNYHCSIHPNMTAKIVIQ